MIKHSTVLTFLLPLVLLINQAYSNDLKTSPSSPSKTIEKQLKQLDPNIPITHIKKSPIDDLYTVILEGSHVIYATNDGKHLIRGDILAINQGSVTNLTELERNQGVAKVLAAIDPNDTVQFTTETPAKGLLYIFTDVDCGYCRKLHQEIPQLSAAGIEVRYLAFPRAGVGSDTYDHMVSAWCSDDKTAAMTALKNGKRVPKKTCQNPVANQFRLGQQLGVSGTPDLFFANGEHLPGYRPAKDIIERLLKSNPHSL